MSLARTLLFASLALSLAVPGAGRSESRLRLATTTSTENSGLLAHLLPRFEAECGCKVSVIAVGTGQALRLGSHGDVDVVLVHAPDLEEAFVADGYGVGRRTFMQNDFVIVGPPVDPAGIRGTLDAALALAAIGEAAAPFVSRGDESGTHHKERALWEAAGGGPSGPWYLEAGQGMGAVLTIAGNKDAYTLADRGTFVARTNTLELQVLVEGDHRLLNPYSVIEVNPERFDWVDADLARRFAEWLCSPVTQGMIAAYEVNATRLFTPTIHPAAGPAGSGTDL